jgi:probable rRNA maturation factor
LKIRIFYDEVKYRLKESKKALNIIEKVIRREKQLPGDLCFIITSDKKLLEINKEFLDHNFFTDVIAFGNKEQKRVGGEIYISIDTVKRNACNYKVSLRNEILRVMIHGTLHLCGYNDNTKKKKDEMSNKEDNWLMEGEKK